VGTTPIARRAPPPSAARPASPCDAACAAPPGQPQATRRSVRGRPPAPFVPRNLDGADAIRKVSIRSMIAYRPDKPRPDGASDSRCAYGFAFASRKRKDQAMG
jgi:hypothetical protein